MEEEMLHSINAMRTMEIIDINTGRKLGFIKDIKIDCNENKIVSIILQGEEKGWFSKGDDIEILWNNISKIGIDVLLVDLEDINNTLSIH